MDISKIVCSPKFAKILNDLGLKQRSIFAWAFNKKENTYDLYLRDPNSNIYGIDDISAYTDTELMMLLPARIIVQNDNKSVPYSLKIEKTIIFNFPLFKEIYIINYRCDSTDCVGEDAWMDKLLFPDNIFDKSFSDALIKTLIYLIENNFINKKDRSWMMNLIGVSGQ